MNNQYIKWGYYGAGLLIGFWNATLFPELELWNWAIIVVITVAILCVFTWILKGSS